MDPNDNSEFAKLVHIFLEDPNDFSFICVANILEKHNKILIPEILENNFHCKHAIIEWKTKSPWNLK